MSCSVKFHHNVFKYFSLPRRQIKSDWNKLTCCFCKSLLPHLMWWLRPIRFRKVFESLVSSHRPKPSPGRFSDQSPITVQQFSLTCIRYFALTSQYFSSLFIYHRILSTGFIFLCTHLYFNLPTNDADQSAVQEQRWCSRSCMMVKSEYIITAFFTRSPLANLWAPSVSPLTLAAQQGDQLRATLKALMCGVGGGSAIAHKTTRGRCFVFLNVANHRMPTFYTGLLVIDRLAQYFLSLMHTLMLVESDTLVLIVTCLSSLKKW